MTTEELYRETIVATERTAAVLGIRPDYCRMWYDAESELPRLRRIESAAIEVLASGQARYTHLGNDGEWPMLFSVDERHFGDLVPAAAMTALRAAVEGEATGDGSGEALPPFDAGIERTAPSADPEPRLLTTADVDAMDRLAEVCQPHDVRALVADWRRMTAEIEALRKAMPNADMLFNAAYLLRGTWDDTCIAMAPSLEAAAARILALDGKDDDDRALDALIEIVRRA